MVSSYNSKGESRYNSYVSATTRMISVTKPDVTKSNFCTSGNVNINNISESCSNGSCKSSGIKISCNSSSCKSCDVNNSCKDILYNGTTSISDGSISCKNGRCNYSVKVGGSSSSGSFYCTNS